MLLQRLLADHGDRFVRREIVAVIFENEQIERRNQAVRGVARSNIDLMIFQCRGEQAQIHDAGWRGEAEARSASESGITVRTLHKFVAKPGAPLRSERGGLR